MTPPAESLEAARIYLRRVLPDGCPVEIEDADVLDRAAAVIARGAGIERLDLAAFKAAEESEREVLGDIAATARGQA